MLECFDIIRIWILLFKQGLLNLKETIFLDNYILSEVQVLSGLSYARWRWMREKQRALIQTYNWYRQLIPRTQYSPPLLQCPKRAE